MATQIGTAYFDVTFNTTAARREVTSLVSNVNRQFGLLGGVAIVGATALIGGLVKTTQQIGAAALGAANDFEQAFAGVIKTLDTADLSVDQAERAFAGINRELREMALVTPLDLEDDLTRIAALGAQMGIPTQALADFTEVIAEVGVTTNVAVEDASLAFARLANIMHIPNTEFRRTADSLIELGNRFPALEDEILRFSLRIAASADLAGFTAQEVLALSTALASVGVPAERGGTAIQRALIKIQQSVAEGTGSLELLGRVSGLTAQEFAELWGRDASEAFTLFVEGLGRSGDQAFEILRQLNLQDQRFVQAFLSIAGAGDLLRRSFEESASAAGALGRESEIFFNTTQANLKLLGNAAHDAGISVGEDMQPAFNDIINSMREWIAANPELIDQLGDELAGALEKVGGLWEEHKDSIADIMVVLPELTSEVIDMVDPLLEVGAALLEVGASWTYVRQQLKEGTESENGLTRFFSTIGEFATQSSFSQLGDNLDLTRQAVDSFDASFRAATGYIESVKDSWSDRTPWQRLTGLAASTAAAFTAAFSKVISLFGGDASNFFVRKAIDDTAAAINEGEPKFRAATTALVELQDRLAGMDQTITVGDWTAFVGTLGLAEGEMADLARRAEELGVVLPEALRRSLGLADEIHDSWTTGFGSGGRGSTGIIPLLGGLPDLFDEGEEGAVSFGEALGDLRDRADDLGVPLSVLLDNAGRLAPDLAMLVDQFGEGSLYMEAFGQALTGLNNAIDLDLGDVIDEFDLLLTVTNKAGDEVPATMKQMLTDLRNQAKEQAELEVGTTILRAMGLDDLAAEIDEEGTPAIGALRGFLKDMDSAWEAEMILDKGATLTKKQIEGVKEALRTGNITPELLILAQGFTSEELMQLIADAGDLYVDTVAEQVAEGLRLSDLSPAVNDWLTSESVQNAIANAGTSSGNLWKTQFVNAFTGFTIPINVTPTISGAGFVVPPAVPSGGSGFDKWKGRGDVNVTIASKGTTTTDAARAAQIISSLVRV